MRLFLVRHGQTAWNKAGKAQGHQEIPLNAEGQAQALALKTAFKKGEIDRIICSDLGRAVETATPLAQLIGIKLEIRQDLRERSFGQWEGASFQEVGLRHGLARTADDPTAFNFRPPGGESFADLWARTQKLAAELRTTNDDTLIVSHGGTLTILLTQLLTDPGYPRVGPAHRSFKFDNCSITELKRREDGALLLSRYNDTSHIPQPVREATS